MSDYKKSRILTYRFFELPHVKRLDVVRELNLIRDEDEGLGDTELLHRIMMRAREEGMLAELWDKVQEQHNDGEYQHNPYRSKREDALCRLMEEKDAEIKRLRDFIRNQDCGCNDGIVCMPCEFKKGGDDD